ncbi:MAG: hypothetical protein ACFB2X_07915 [Rivularia sp. (in: cyanobacteria)]
MNNNQNQPKQYDAVLGGNAPPPIHGAVLGGVEGVKKRLANSNVDVQIAALNDALNYGDVGLDLVIDALEHESTEINNFAAKILKRSENKRGKKALLENHPKLYFTRVEDWKQEYYDPKFGIQNPLVKAYVVNHKNFYQLLENSNLNQIEALIYEIELNFQDFKNPYKRPFYDFVNAISQNNDKLINLKAIYIGRELLEGPYGFKHYISNSYIKLGYLNPLLKAYPHLEVLQVYGRQGLRIQPLQHNFLKTLRIQTELMCKYSAIPNICKLDLPALEYLELWFGGSSNDERDIVEKELSPILTGELLPNLKYLGLCGSRDSYNLVLFLIKFPTAIEQLSILDLSGGNLSDRGAEILLHFPAINKLSVLKLTMNDLSEEMIKKLYKLECEVIAEPQDLLLGF